MDVLIATMPLELYEQLRRQGSQTRTDTARRIHAGETIRQGERRPTIFRIARANIERGVPEELVGELMLQLNQARCDPPLGREEVLAQVRGAGKWVPKPDEAGAALQRQAAEFLREFEQGKATESQARAKGEKPWTKRRRELQRRATSAIPARSVKWLIPGLVPRDTLVSIVGEGGLGKSSIALGWAAEVTRGGSNALVVSYEDAPEQVIRPRFEAQEGDLDRLFVLSIDPVEGSISFPIDLGELERHAVETEAQLVVIDPISAGLDAQLDSHKDSHVRIALAGLAGLAERLDLAVLMVGHLNKASGSDPYIRVGGSVGFFNASRSVVVTTRDPADPDWRRLVTQVKSNYGRLAPVERWRVELADVPSEEGPISIARLVFDEIAADVDRSQVLSPLSAEKRSEAEALILVELAQGRRLSADVKAVGVKTGFSAATMKRAAATLEVVVEEETTESGRVTFWSLPRPFGDRLTPSYTQDEPTPPEPHNHAENGGRLKGSAHDAEKEAEPTPRPGESDYLEYLLALGEQGLITTDQWFELSAEHERIVRGRA
jgi:hypothetical protein